ncbi:MAG: hypothetical protein HOE30_06625, partial [Deltaproteobacteria bacterium]|nr:hypothetical protein [Deltaproteobacteria bacterium]
MKRKLKIQFVLVLLILPVSISNLHAQSFLSHQRTARNPLPIHLEENNKTNEILPERVAVEQVTQTKVRILSDSAPTLALPVGKIQVEAPEQLFEKEQEDESGPVVESTTYKLDMVSLTRVSSLVKQGEY